MTTEVNETAEKKNETRMFISPCKVIYATGCTLGEFSEKFDLELSPEHDPEWYGYVTIEDGHPEWEDADSFNEKYDSTTCMDFACAYAAMRQGFKVGRSRGTVFCPKVMAMAAGMIVGIEGDKAYKYDVNSIDIAEHDWYIVDNERVSIDCHTLTVTRYTKFDMMA
jgi:hypothetical protein